MKGEKTVILISLETVIFELWIFTIFTKNN